MDSLGNHNETIVEVTVVGPDRKGVVAEITNAIFKRGGNIQQISQNVVRGLFGMQLEASFCRTDRNELDESLRLLSRKLKMEIKIHYQEPDRLKNIAVLVSKEEHCLRKILDARTNGEIDANISVIVGTDNTFMKMAKEAGIPYHIVNHRNSQEEAESHILTLIEDFNVDLIVLARYMRVLTPNFVWRYPNRIINIHPSLLPAFPGAYAYVQAYERGAKIVGCTAHFVTDELDQGPIICQDAFSVLPSDTLESIKEKGRDLEAKALVKAIKLYLEDKLEVYWGRVQVRERFR
ncbi:MAG TPA: phosphoribosylglycinamide formyltransferase [Nitrososphaeraceae archaeon]|nr:phosphoribosylglycinamide formyltransferase [Nitrososphaeraceae archaeon]